MIRMSFPGQNFGWLVVSRAIYPTQGGRVLVVFFGVSIAIHLHRISHESHYFGEAAGAKHGSLRTVPRGITQTGTVSIDLRHFDFWAAQRARSLPAGLRKFHRPSREQLLSFQGSGSVRSLPATERRYGVSETSHGCLSS